MRDRLNALSDAARTGKPRQYDRETDRRVLALLDQDPPRGDTQWNGRLLAEALGDVSADHTWRILRKYKIQLQRPGFSPPPRWQSGERFQPLL